MRASTIIVLAIALLCSWSPPSPRGHDATGGDQSFQEETDSPQERENLEHLVKTCRKCHEDVCSEWEGTQHAMSWTDPVFQAAIKELPDQGESCAPCHAPQELLLTGYGKVPLARKKDRELGVNCVTCHMKGNRYFGPYESSGHGGIDASPEFRQVDLCLSCHGQPLARLEHDQGTSYLKGPAAAEGATCQSCHMPSVERKLVSASHIKDKYTIGVQPCRAHSFTGARRNEIVAGCAELGVSLRGGKIELTILPKTGHSLPASTGRDVVLEIVMNDGEGREVSQEKRIWRFPDGPVLDPGVKTEIVIEAGASVHTVKARLVQILVEVPGRREEVVQPIAEATSTR